MAVLPVAVACFAVLVISAAILAVAMNRTKETSMNAAGARGDPGRKQKTCPPRYRKPPADQKQA